MIQGWTEGLHLMVEGERTRFWVPEKWPTKDSPGQATRDAGVRHRSHQDRAAHHDAVLTEYSSAAPPTLLRALGARSRRAVRRSSVGEGESEDQPGAAGRRLRPHPSAMRLDDSSGDIEPQPRSAWLAGRAFQ